MKQHPCTAGLFRDMDVVEFETLVADIKTHGQRHPIVLHEGMVLDGWNRWRACKRLNLEPKTVEFKGPGDPRDYVVSTNVERRHLSPTDRAKVGLKLYRVYEKEASARQKASQAKPGEKVGKAPIPGGAPYAWTGDTSEHVAGIVGVGKSTIERAVFVEDNAPELLKDPEYPTTKQQYAEARRRENEKEQAAADKLLSKADRQVLEEKTRIKEILSGQKRLAKKIDESIDEADALTERGCKDLEPVLKDLRAAAGKMRSVLQKVEGEDGDA